MTDEKRPWTFEIRGRIPLTEQQEEELADRLVPAGLTFTHDMSSGELAVRGTRENPWGALAIALARTGLYAHSIGVTDLRLAVTVEPGLLDSEVETWLKEMGFWPIEEEGESDASGVPGPPG